MEFKKVDSLNEITGAGCYEYKHKRFNIEYVAEEYCGLHGYNLTGYYGANGSRMEIYCGPNGGNNVYQCKKLITILKHVNNLLSFYIN